MAARRPSHAAPTPEDALQQLGRDMKTIMNDVKEIKKELVNNIPAVAASSCSCCKDDCVDEARASVDLGDMGCGATRGEKI